MPVGRPQLNERLSAMPSGRFVSIMVAGSMLVSSESVTLTSVSVMLTAPPASVKVVVKLLLPVSESLRSRSGAQLYAPGVGLVWV